MSRSKRKTPIVGITTARSEKQEKRIINRALRRKSKVILKDVDAEGDFHLPTPNDYMNVWSMAKDGKMLIDKVDPPKCEGCEDRIRCITDEEYKEYGCRDYWRYNLYRKAMRK